MFDDFKTWLTARAAGLTGKHPRPATLASYEMRLRGALRIGGFSSPEELSTCLTSRPEWYGLLDPLYAQQKPVTVQGTVMAVRHYGNFAVAAGLIDSHAVAPLDGPRAVPQKPIVVYTADEVAKLLLYAKAGGNLRLWMLLATLAETGRRVSEMLGITRRPQAGRRPSPHRPTRTKARQCCVPLTRLLREEVWTPENIARLKSKSHARYTRSAEVYPFSWSYKNAVKHMSRLCEAADIEYRAFQVFRHTRATALIARGVPIAGVSSLRGHANVATTDRLYSHVNALDFTRYID